MGSIVIISCARLAKQKNKTDLLGIHIFQSGVIKEGVENGACIIDKRMSYKILALKQ